MNDADAGGRPVFIVGCPRSGTTLLYHMLVSSGHFVDYRAETHFYDAVLPFFGPFSSRSNLERFLDGWLQSASFRRFGVDAERVRSAVAGGCISGGEFLETVFSLAGEQQGRVRWAECTPLHVLYMDQIQRDLPDAVFVHMIRDGRDVALSLSKVGWMKPLPWERTSTLETAALSWEWLVTRGKALGTRVGEAYHEVRFEDLVTSPEPTLARLSDIVQCRLDYSSIRENAVGSVARPNTSFSRVAGSTDESFSPIGRWKAVCSGRELALLQAAIGPTLGALDYPPAPHVNAEGTGPMLAFRRLAYRIWASGRHWFKKETRLARILSRPDFDRL